jgi:hypothetical protein
MATLYYITSIQDEYIYINTTQDFNASVSVHLKLLREGKHPVEAIQNMYDKYGEENIIFCSVREIADNEVVSKKLAYRQKFSLMN